jgi:hypothetical protein
VQVNTQSHAILTFFLLRWGLGRRISRLKGVNTVLFSGALLPDLPIFLFFFWYTLIDATPQRIIWKELCFHPGWQTSFNLFHSLPVWATFALLCSLFKYPRGALFSTAGFLAASEDLLLHHDDAHAHFWPFSEFRFTSPVSYWDPAHYGHIASALELLLVLAASVWTWRRLETRWGKMLLVLAVTSLTLTHGLWSFLFRFF